MSEIKLEKSEMSELAFVSTNLRNRVAPNGSVGERILAASRRLGWGYSRTKDLWYADRRASVKPAELRQIEKKVGLRYGQEELRSVEDMLARADALLDGPDADFHRPFVVAFRAFVGALDSTGASNPRE